VQPDAARWQQCRLRLRDAVRTAHRDPTAQFDAAVAELHGGRQPLFDAATLEVATKKRRLLPFLRFFFSALAFACCAVSP
jgi:hypothetical protein